MPGDVVTGLDLHQHISDLLTGRASFGEFNDWLTGSTWEDSDVALDALPLVRSIQLALAEFSSGHRTWPDVRRYLVEMATWVSAQMSWDMTPSPTVTTTGSTVVTRVVMLPDHLPDLSAA
jgi:hypothetical protein